MIQVNLYLCPNMTVSKIEGVTDDGHLNVSCGGKYTDLGCTHNHWVSIAHHLNIDRKRLPDKVARDGWD